MNSLLAWRALLFAGECFAASLFLLSLAWAATRFVKAASLRHFIWLTAFGTMLVLPLAAVIVPAQVAIQRAAPVRDVPVYVEITTPVEAAAPAAPIALPDPAPRSVWPVLDERDAAIGLLALWLMGFGWAVSRLAMGALGLRAIRGESRPHTLASADLPNIAMSGRECELRLSVVQGGPMTWGILRPVILLPKASLLWSRERLQAVLLHELAHVRRRDSLSQALALFACALYWFNPLAWIGLRALRREAEIAADDVVIGYGMRPSAYAGELLQIASEFRGQRGALAGVAMAAQSSLEARVKSVLAPNQSRKGVTPMDALRIALLGAAATAVLALARPDIVQAQDSMPPPPPVSSAPLPPPPPEMAAPAAPADAPSPPDVADTAPLPPTPPVPHMHHVSHVAPVAPVTMVDADNDDEAPAAKVKKTVVVHVYKDKNGHRHVVRTDHISPEDQAQIDRADVEAQRAEDEVARIQPEIDRALANAKIDEKVAKALRDVEPRVRAEVARAMAQARPEIRKALAEAHIDETVAKAMRDVQPQIDAAVRQAQQESKRVRVEVRRDHVAPEAQEPGDAEDNDQDNDQ
jgi:beta-lactamase regulating signal transducer with metallopeptidase domain